jgi:hypothetical protein
MAVAPGRVRRRFGEPLKPLALGQHPVAMPDWVSIAIVAWALITLGVLFHAVLFSAASHVALAILLGWGAFTGLLGFFIIRGRRR